MDAFSLSGSNDVTMALFDISAIKEKDRGCIKLKFGPAPALVTISKITARGERLW